MQYNLSLMKQRIPLKLSFIYKEDLGEEQRKNIVSALENAEGITGAEFFPLRYHLIVASYDRNVISSQDVLKNFNSLNVEAKLIGPI